LGLNNVRGKHRFIVGMHWAFQTRHKLFFVLPVHTTLIFHAAR